MGWAAAGAAVALLVATATGEVIRVGMYENAPKIYTAADGKISGFFPVLLRHIAEQEGWQLEFLPGTWQECLDRLAAGELDIMPDVAVTPERAEKYDFSAETVLISWAVIYTRPEIKVQSFLDLAGRRIALIRGGVYSSGAGSIRQILSQFGVQAEFVEYRSYREVLQALNDGQADAGVVNNIFGSAAEKDFRVARSPVLFSPSQLRFAFPKGSARGRRLAGTLDARLVELKQDPMSFFYRAMDRELFGAPEVREAARPENWSQALSAHEKEWLAQHPNIRVGIDPEFYPFEFRDESGSYQGMSSDYVKLLNERLGLNLQVADLRTWTGVVAGVKSGEIDVLSCVGITEERQHYLVFTKPYIRFQRVILTRLDAPFLTGLSDLKTWRVGVQGGSSHEGFLREKTTLQPTVFGSLEEALLALSGGKVEAVVANLASAAYWIRKLNLINLKMAAPASSELFTLHFAVRNDWPELQSILDKGLDLVTPEQQRTIEQRWVAVEYKPGLEPGVVWTAVWRAAAGVVAVLLAFLLWALRLKQEIRRRQRIERQLNFREGFERLVAETSSRFIALKPEEIDRHIRATLAEIACFIKADAAYLCAFDERGLPVLTHAGGETEALAAAGLSAGDGPRDAAWMGRLREGQPVTRALAGPAPAAAVVEVACADEQDVTGLLGVLTRGAGAQAWSAEDLSLLRLLGQILTHALRRKGVEEAMARYAADLEAANRKLQDLDQLKNMFIASVSHELRTPLNSIIGFTGVILRGMAGEVNDKQRDQLQRVYHSAQHLLELITDIIDISKIEAGRIDRFVQEFPLEPLVREAAESLRPQFEAKGLALELDLAPGLTLCTDRKRVRQCLLNYLSNALKYSERGVVRVVTRDLGADFEITVSDTGIGMTPEEQARLFEPFVRLDSHLRIKAGGTGLGLYLTRKIALEILQGSIAVASEKGRGSTFTLRAARQLAMEPPVAAGGEAR